MSKKIMKKRNRYRIMLMKLNLNIYKNKKLNLMVKNQDKIQIAINKINQSKYCQPLSNKMINKTKLLILIKLNLITIQNNRLKLFLINQYQKIKCLKQWLKKKRNKQKAINKINKQIIMMLYKISLSLVLVLLIKALEIHKIILSCKI